MAMTMKKTAYWLSRLSMRAGPALALSWFRMGWNSWNISRIPEMTGANLIGILLRSEFAAVSKKTGKNIAN